MSTNIVTNKSEYIALFDKFAKTAIKKDTDGFYLYGHCVNVQQFDNGTWDVGLCNQKEYVTGNLQAYLGTGKLNNLIATIPDTFTVHRMDGEAFFQSEDIDAIKAWLLDNRLSLGIKKRKDATNDNLKSSRFGAKSTDTETV